MSTGELLSVIFGCTGAAVCVGTAARSFYWGLASYLVLIMLVAPLWNISHYVEELAKP